MKLLSILALLSFSAVSLAAESFSCKATMMHTEKKIEFKVGKQTVQIEGIGTVPIVEKVSMEIDGAKVNECMGSEKSQSHECLKALVPDAKDKDDSKLSLLTNLLSIAPNSNEEEDLPGRKDIDFTKIKSGTIHVIMYGGYYPNIGIYEYFDEKGELVSRMFHELYARNCR